MQTNFSTITVVGLGYIGLPTAAVLASRKLKVIGVDVNDHVVDLINQGRIHIVEPDLDILVHASVSEGYLTATTQPKPADVFLIAVPTPFIVGQDGSYTPDISFIKAATKSIAPVLKRGSLVILESTSPVGTTEQMASWLGQERPDLTFPQEYGENSDIRIAYCPERVLPGRVLEELVTNDRVIGGLTEKCSIIASQLYKTFVKGECIVTNARTAEMCKLTENSYRDVNIAFANELSIICDKLDINIWELINLANRHPRVNILRPGSGVGGHCIAVDPWFIVSKTPSEAQLIRSARLVNDSKPEWVLNKLKALLQHQIKQSNNTKKRFVVACLGLSFKPDIDDLRESPAVYIAGKIADLHNIELMIVEPHIMQLPDSLENKATLSSINEVKHKADIVIILVAHQHFKESKVNQWKDINIMDVCGLNS